jgi:DNA-binding transcriptional MerR regulator
MYTIKEAAARTGLSVPVLRAWERRYGVVEPERTPAGYRLYNENDLARLRAMRDLVTRGWSPSTAAASIVDHPPEPELPAARNSAEPAALVKAFADAAARMDAAHLEQILDEMTSLGSFEHVAQAYLLPAMVAVGDGWERGDLDVAAEHSASHAVLRRLAAAFEAAGRGGTESRPVLVGLPPGARHELGGLAFSVAARRAGLRITYVGADLPVADWVEAVELAVARAAVIAVPTSADRAAAKELIVALLSANPSGLVVAVGGRGTEADGWPTDVTLLPPGLVDAVDELRRALRSVDVSQGQVRGVPASDRRGLRGRGPGLERHQRAAPP